MRIPGVLQRIGLTYLAAAVITVDATDTEQWTIAAGLLMVHWALLVIPFGGPASGHLEPGRNIAAAIDRSLFGSHMLSPAGDPEGALGLLSSVATALLGSTVGRWLLRARSVPARSATHTRAAVETRARRDLRDRACLGLGRSCFRSTSRSGRRRLRCSPPVWPRSASWEPHCSTSRRCAPRLAPFVWLGTNPLAVYFLSELTTDLIQIPWFTVGGHHTALKDWFFWWVLAPRVGDSGGAWSSLIYALLYTVVWIGVAGMMRWRGVRFRV